MFLSKKNAIYFNKPKNADPNKPKRILPGWQDEEQEKKDKYEYTSSKVQTKVQPSNLLLGDQFSDLTADLPVKKQTGNKFYLNWDQLDSNNDIQCQKRLIEEIVLPGGIRIKPNDTMLNDFLKEIKGMEVHIIGSLLLSKLQVNYPFQTKAKALYIIQFLSKKNQVYLSYFKAHVQKIRQFPEPEDNVQNYRKILKSVLNIIGVAVVNQNSGISQQPKTKFVDPGYNDDPKSLMSNFIQQNAAVKGKKADNKKVIIGPGQSKPKASHQVQKKEQNNDDFMTLDLLGSGINTATQKPKGDSSLFDIGQGGQLSFQQMMSGINMGHSGPAQKNGGNINLLI